MKEEEIKPTKVTFPRHTLSQMVDYATDTCEDWKEINYHEWKGTELYWFRTEQLKKLIKHCMQEGARLALKDLET